MSVAANPIDQRTRAMSGLAHRMKCARISLDLTQEQLAERLGIARQTLTGYEKGHTDPPVSLLAQFCGDYHIDPQWLLLGVRRRHAAEDGDYELRAPQTGKESR